MSITRADFGTLDSKPVSLYTLTNKNGLIAKISDYGGIVTELYTPDRDGKMADIVLGFETLDGYVTGSPYFGAMVGRVGNRIANGRFTLDEREYQLAINNGPNHLHGGARGFDMEIRTTEPGAQFYSGSFLSGLNGKGGAIYKKQHGFCLETQHYPDSINNEGKDGWPTMILRPRQTYRHTMIHKFTTDG